MCQTRYVAEAIQKLYKHEKKDNTKELHTERSTTANLDKNISFQGLSEILRFSLVVYALKHFDSTQNNIYRKSNGMKLTERYTNTKAPTLQLIARADSQHMNFCKHNYKGRK